MVAKFSVKYKHYLKEAKEMWGELEKDDKVVAGVYAALSVACLFGGIGECLLMALVWFEFYDGLRYKYHF